MRPCKLTISAFGPYAEKQEFDMNSLGDKGLYLIAGDTGAGKTTIFEAIDFLRNERRQCCPSMEKLGRERRRFLMQ